MLGDELARKGTSAAEGAANNRAFKTASARAHRFGKRLSDPSPLAAIKL